MDIKFCARDGCKEIAVGTGIRPIEFCRKDYVATYGDQFEEWNVVIPHAALRIDPEDLAIACARTGEDISAGTVWLDPVETNIPALVYAGFIKAAEAPKAPAKAAKTGA